MESLVARWRALLLALLVLQPAISQSEEGRVGEFKVEPQNPIIVDCERSAPGCREVLQCSRFEHDCAFRWVAFDRAGCSAKEKPVHCENFAERFAEATIIADRYNFVSVPFTRESFDVELVNNRLRIPWDLDFLPDGSMLVTEKHGIVVYIGKSGSSHYALELKVHSRSKSGLMGLAVDPDFEGNNYVYLGYSYAIDKSDPDFDSPKNNQHRRILNRISRFTFDGGLLSGEKVLLDRIPGSNAHTGMRLEFGPDGKLYATTGDAYLPPRSQDWDFLGGKILRLNADGSVPADNPIPGNPAYSRGHRNPQGLAWQPQTGALFASEHGPNRLDELNLIVPGANYGWGSFGCDSKDLQDIKELQEVAIEPLSEVTPPVVCLRYWTAGPSGMEFVSDPESPWYGNLFMASLRGRHLHRYVISGDTVEKSEVFYVPKRDDFFKYRIWEKVSSRIRDVEYHDGSLYILDDYNMLIKLTPRQPESGTRLE